MKIITPATLGLYHAWVDNAVHDPQLTRFYGSFWSWHAAAPDGTWARTTFVTDCARGCAELTFRRPIEADLSVFCCRGSDPTHTSRPVLAGMLMLAVAAHLATTGIPWILTSCAETNAAASRLNHKVFGTPYGREPAGCWDGQKREYVHRLMWKRSIVELVEKNSAIVRRVTGSAAS